MHPQFGAGHLIKTYMGGYEWEVVFESGRRFRLPAREFAAESVATVQAQVSTPVVRGFEPRELVLEMDQFRARQTLEALRLGIVPVQDVETLTIGLEAEQVSLDRALARSREHGGDVLAIVGDYGFGKSHFVELTARRALREQMLVASASLDLVEMPPNRPQDIYRALVQSLRYPDSPERGLAPLISRALATPGLVDQFVARSPLQEQCPLSRALLALMDCSSQSTYDEIINWVSGQTKPTRTMRECLSKPPRLYVTGDIARQYVYLLSAIAELASLTGYGGLAVLVDESEHYSLLRARQRPRAEAFFQAMIYAALGPTGARFNAEEVPIHTKVEYPIAFSEASHLFFLFALTESDSRLPIDEWLARAQIVRLDDRFIERDIQAFFKILARYHSIAYGYTYPLPDERSEPIEATVPVLLGRALSRHRINLREVIRTAVSVCDLLYLYPHDPPDRMLTELREGLRV